MKTFILLFVIAVCIFPVYVHTQGGSVCIPKTFTSLVYTSLTTTDDDDSGEDLMEFKGTTYYDIAQQAEVAYYEDIVSGESVTILILYNQGVQYLYTNYTCGTTTFPTTTMSNCYKYDSMTGPFMMANQWSTNLYYFYPSSTQSIELLTASNNFFPISERSTGPLTNNSVYIEEKVILYYSGSTNPVPASVFAPPTTCNGTSVAEANLPFLIEKGGVGFRARKNPNYIN